MVLLPPDKLFKITIYSHFFKVTGYQARMTPILTKFHNKYAQMGFGKDDRGRNTYMPLRYFGIVNHVKREYRYHIGQLPDFMKLLAHEYIQPELYEVETVPLYEPVKYKLVKNGNKELRDYQVEAKDFIVAHSDDDYRTRLIALGTGLGKDQPLTEPILTPNGWKFMGEMKVGDEVITRCGDIAKVDGVFPQGCKDIYRVYFEDGRFTDCGLGHLWKVYLATKEKTVDVIETNEIIRYLSTKTVKDRLYVDLFKPEKGIHKNLSIDPYLLGYLLGNGILRHNSLIVVTPDKWTISELENLIDDQLEIKYLGRYHYRIKRISGLTAQHPLINKLRILKLFNCLSYNKFIPEDYLNSSKEQRLFLLQGLLDSDGTADKNGTIQFCSTSKKLALGVQYLIRSLGGLASISYRNPFYTYKGEKKEGRLAYIVNIRYPKPSELFRLPRKKERCNDTNQYAANLKLRIKGVVPIGRAESQCISIDHPSHLYVTRDFIVTHNTFCGLASIIELGERFLIVVLSKYQEKWISDIEEAIKIDPKDIAVINGSGKLGGLISLAKDKQLKAKAIIISLVTLRNYFKDYEKNPDDVIDVTYGCAPEDLCKLLGVGVLLVDEAHEHIHAVYQLLTHTHVPKAIMLTATMTSNEHFINQMHKIMFPKEIRFDKVKMEQYIAVYPVAYQFKDYVNSRIRTQAWGSNMYSHITFEQSLMKNKPLLADWLDMILHYVKEAYVDKYIKGDKLAIYAASIEMCNTILDYLNKQMAKGIIPKYDARRYAEQDPYENVIDSDIRVTTVLSAGTAIDIPNLRAVVMTNCILAPVSNLQVLGRLRKLKDRDVKFYYLYCTQIPKQVECHNVRKELFKDRVSSIKVLLHDHPLQPIYSQYHKKH